MTTIAVLADPPREGDVLARLVDREVLGAEEAVTLYTALLRDACDAVERSGGDLLVNYRDRTNGDGDPGPTNGSDGGAEDEPLEAVRDAVSPVLADPDAARYEVQVGSTRSARVGNTVTHLLEREGVRSAAVLDPTVSLLGRRHVDQAAMKLRGTGVVLGPSTAGRVWYAAFAQPVDFADALEPPAVETLTDRAMSEGTDVDFVENLPVVHGPDDLATVVSLVRARRQAGKPVPEYTAGAIDRLGLRTIGADDGVRVECE